MTIGTATTTTLTADTAITAMALDWLRGALAAVRAGACPMCERLIEGHSRMLCGSGDCRAHARMIPVALMERVRAEYQRAVTA